MYGATLVKALLEIKGELKVILVSGCYPMTFSSARGVIGPLR
jgi:hypothetical protein